MSEDPIPIDPDMAQALTDNRDDLMALDGITGFGIGTDDSGALCLTIMVADLESPPDLPEALGGFPVQWVERNPVVLSGLPDRAVYPTVIGGIEVGHGASGIHGSGTLGCVLRDLQNGLAPVGISCVHVLGGTDPYAIYYGDEIWQPNAVGSRVGTLLRWEIPSLPSPNPGDVPSGLWDAAICALERTARVGEIAEIGTVTGIGSVRGVLQPVRKRGRTTGLTYGVVRTMFLSVKTTHDGDTGGWWLHGQLEIYPTDDPDLNPNGFAQEGDSGSVVVDEDNQIVALLHGGGGSVGVGFATDFAPLAIALGVTL